MRLYVITVSPSLGVLRGTTCEGDTCARHMCRKAAHRAHRAHSRGDQGSGDEGLPGKRRLSGPVGPLPAGRLLPAVRHHRAQRIRRVQPGVPDRRAAAPLRAAGRQPHGGLARLHHTCAGEPRRSARRGDDTQAVTESTRALQSDTPV